MGLIESGQTARFGNRETDWQLSLEAGKPEHKTTGSMLRDFKTDDRFDQTPTPDALSDKDS